MVTKVQKWGNSQGLRLTKQVLEEAHLAPGEEVDVSVEAGVIIISPKRKIRGKYRLKDLVARHDKHLKTEEISWGQPIGKEVW
jgi:antitoxin MazE